MISPNAECEFKLTPDDLWIDALNYPFPEARQLLGRLSVNERLFMNTLSINEAEALLEEGGFLFNPHLVLPERNGYLHPDNFDDPFTQRIRARYDERFSDLSSFAHNYVTAGSTPAINTLIAEWACSGEMTQLAVLSDNYIGYELSANACRFQEEAYKVQSLEDAGEPVDGRI